MRRRDAAMLALLAGLLSACSSDQPVRGFSTQMLRAVERMSDQDFAVPVDGGQTALLPVFSEKKLTEPHPGLKRAVIGIQDPLRNAGIIFDALKLAVGEGGESMILVPQFLAAQDVERHGLGPDFARWTIEGWRDGGNSRPSGLRDTGALVSSFGVLDAMLLYLADRTLFPDLTEIVITGYGFSGRMVQLYAASGKGFGAPAAAGINLRFVVAASDTYVYFDEQRPGRGETGFAPFERETCQGFNQWPYGAVLPVVYAYGQSGLQMARIYAGLDVTYLIGERDNDPVDRSCEARAQGRSRIERAEMYLKHVGLVAGTPPARQRIAVARGADASAAGLFASTCGRAVLTGGSC